MNRDEKRKEVERLREVLAQAQNVFVMNFESARRRGFRVAANRCGPPEASIAW